jgi:hypothetical protein
MNRMIITKICMRKGWRCTMDQQVPCARPVNLYLHQSLMTIRLHQDGENCQQACARVLHGGPRERNFVWLLLMGQWSDGPHNAATWRSSGNRVVNDKRVDRVQTKRPVLLRSCIELFIYITAVTPSTKKPFVFLSSVTFISFLPSLFLSFLLYFRCCHL